MFPREADIENFKVEFGSEGILRRLEIRRRGCHAIQAATVIMPNATKDATLMRAWRLVRSIAHWIIACGTELPVNERYEIIIGWSKSVRKLQGQIFKVSGDRAAVQAIADSESWIQCGCVPLLRWEKDVF
jgi:hypothetical protein